MYSFVMEESFFVNSHLLDTITTIPPYTLTPEQEKKEILRHYRSLLRSLKTKLKKGDKELVRTAFEMAVDAHKTMRRKKR